MSTQREAGSVEGRLLELGITLPQPPAPAGAYVPVQRVGSLLYTSGVLPMDNGRLVFAGVVGGGLTVEQGAQAARLCALNILALVAAHCGSLDQIEQVVQLTGFVRSAPGFTQQPLVLNGASETLYAVLGERGRHTRMALGASELPLGTSVEIAAIVRLTA